MKAKLFLFILCIVPILLTAQNDSTYREIFYKNVKEFRKEKAVSPIFISKNLNAALESIVNKANRIKDSSGKFNRDSVMSIMRKNNVYDYQFEINEVSKPRKVSSGLKYKLSSKLQNSLLDSSNNSIGISSGTNADIVIVSKHYVDFDNYVQASIKRINFDHPEMIKETITITGTTELDGLSFCSFDYSGNVEKDIPIVKRQIIKKGNLFKVELDVTRTNKQIPYKICIVDEKNKIISQFNFTNK